MTRNFNLFYKELVKDDNAQINLDFSKSLFENKENLLEPHFKRAVYNFIYDKAVNIYNINYAEMLCTKLHRGEIKLVNMQQYLFKDKPNIAETVRFGTLLQQRQLPLVNTVFSKTGLSWFFANLFALSFDRITENIKINILDFNIMLHIYIQKAMSIKNYQEVKEKRGKDSTFSNATYGAFKIFRWKYKAEVSNQIKVKLRALINGLSTSYGKKNELVTLSIVDKPQVDKLRQEYRFDNVYSGIEIDDKQIWMHTNRILNAYEKRADSKLKLPRLRVYLCTSQASNYLFIKSIAEYCEVDIDYIINKIKYVDIDNWNEEAIDGVCKIVRPYTSVGDYDLRRYIMNSYDRAMNSYDGGRSLIIDKDLLKEVCKRHIDNLELVIYDYGSDLSSPSSSETEIDYKYFSDKYTNKEELLANLKQSYIDAQTINLFRRLVVKDNNCLKTRVINVPEEELIEVRKIIVSTNKSLCSDMLEYFRYEILLDTSKIQEVAKILRKEKGTTTYTSYFYGAKTPKGTTYSKAKYRRNLVDRTHGKFEPDETEFL